MYCINCGVRLADTEGKCPLCNTVVFHPDIERPSVRPLYPSKRMPQKQSGSKVICGAVIILFFIPLIVSFLCDIHGDGRLNWFGYVAGALLVFYTVFALPLWFRKPNPVIFVPCGFVATALYLLYIDLATRGGWFISFAFPLTGGLCIITCAVVTLLYYLGRGKLYIWGGGLIALGLYTVLIEFLLHVTFGIDFVGWSVYPLAVLVLLGGALIYLAINKTAREIMERKLFF